MLTTMAAASWQHLPFCDFLPPHPALHPSSLTSPHSFSVAVDRELGWCRVDMWDSREKRSRTEVQAGRIRRPGQGTVCGSPKTVFQPRSAPNHWVTWNRTLPT